MRLIDADELMEHVWRDKLDSRELIANMVYNAPTVKEIPTNIPISIFLRLISQERVPSAGGSEKPNKCEDAISADVQNHWIGAEVLDNIRTEIIELSDGEIPERIWNVDVLRIINKYKKSEGEA